MSDDETTPRRRKKKEGASLIVSAGMDEARAYVSPRELPKLAEHKTMEMQRVRLIDPRQVPTQKKIEAQWVRPPGEVDPDEVLLAQAAAAEAAAPSLRGAASSEAPVLRGGGKFQEVEVDPAMALEFARQQAERERTRAEAAVHGRPVDRRTPPGPPVVTGPIPGEGLPTPLVAGDPVPDSKRSPAPRGIVASVAHSEHRASDRAPDSAPPSSDRAAAGGAAAAAPTVQSVAAAAAHLDAAPPAPSPAPAPAAAPSDAPITRSNPPSPPLATRSATAPRAPERTRHRAALFLFAIGVLLVGVGLLLLSGPKKVADQGLASSASAARAVALPALEPTGASAATPPPAAEAPALEPPSASAAPSAKPAKKPRDGARAPGASTSTTGDGAPKLPTTAQPAPAGTGEFILRKRGD